jgi:hypothetical protein
MKSGTLHILLEKYVPFKGVNSVLKEPSTLKREQQVSPEYRNFLQTATAMSLRLEGSVISLTDVVYRTVLAYIWFVRAGSDWKNLLGIIKTRYFKKIKKNMRKNLASE